jgi:hypothetical protein
MMNDFAMDLFDSEPKARRTKKRNLGLSDEGARRHVRAAVIVSRHEERRKKREEREGWR